MLRLLLACSAILCLAADEALANALPQGERLVATYMPIGDTPDVLVVAGEDGSVRLAPGDAPEATITGPPDAIEFLALARAGEWSAYAILRNGEATGERLELTLIDEHWMRLTYFDESGRPVTDGALRAEERLFEPVPAAVLGGHGGDRDAPGTGGGTGSSSGGPDDMGGSKLPPPEPPPNDFIFITSLAVATVVAVVLADEIADGAKAIAQRKGATNAPPCTGNNQGCSISGSGVCSDFGCPGTCIPCVTSSQSFPTDCNCS